MSEKTSEDHLEWLVRNRSRNQKTSLNLYEMLKRHEKKIKADSGLMLLSQTLIAINFSLWRSVFLTDKELGTAKRLEHAEEFLIKLIVDNAVGYPLERTARNWTFGYYLNNARYRISELSEKFPKILKTFKKETNGHPRRLWENLQKALDTSVKNFSNLIEKSNPV